MTDYNMKPSLDIQGIASLMQKKASAEQEQKNFERQQRLKEVEFAVQTGTNLAKGMVEASKMRQQKEFADALGNAARTPGATVQSDPSVFQVPATAFIKDQYAGSSSDGTRTMPVVGAQEGSDGTVAPVPGGPSAQLPPQENDNSRLLRAAAMASPDQAAKQYLEKQFTEKTGPNSGTQGTLQKLTLQGTAGSRNVQVMQIGNQFYTPGTNQPVDIYNPSQVDTLPEVAFVARAYKAGTTPDGRVVMADPNDRIHPLKLMTPDGQMGEPYGGKLMPALANPTSQETDQMRSVMENAANMRDAWKDFRPEFVGPVAGRMASIKQWFNGTTDEKQVEFNNMLAEIDSVRRHDFYGAALTPTEVKFWNGISLDTNVSPKAFAVRYEALMRKLKNRSEAIQRSAESAGRPFRGGPSDSDFQTQPQDSGNDLGDGFSYEVVQ